MTLRKRLPSQTADSLFMNKRVVFDERRFGVFLRALKTCLRELRNPGHHFNGQADVHAPAAGKHLDDFRITSLRFAAKCFASKCFASGNFVSGQLHIGFNASF